MCFYNVHLFVSVADLLTFSAQLWMTSVLFLQPYIFYCARESCFGTISTEHYEQNSVTFRGWKTGESSGTLLVSIPVI
jgi:hypothetical protein